MAARSPKKTKTDPKHPLRRVFFSTYKPDDMPFPAYLTALRALYRDNGLGALTFDLRSEFLRQKRQM